MPNDEELRKQQLKKDLEKREPKRIKLLEENIKNGLWPRMQDDVGPDPLW